jgi:hypothetical protein
MPARFQQFCNLRYRRWSPTNHHLEVAMNIIRRFHRLAGLLAISAGALLVLAVASPAMAATVSIPPYGPPVQVPVQSQTVTAGGLPVWQVALIAAGAAVLAAIVAVAADRARAARRHITAPGM